MVSLYDFHDRFKIEIVIVAIDEDFGSVSSGSNGSGRDNR